MLLDLMLDPSIPVITADDKDFKRYFSVMVDLSTKVVNQFEALTSPEKTPELDEDDLIQIGSAKERLLNSFLDDIFGSDNLLERNEYERRVARFGRWIFNSQALRDKI